MTPGSRSFFLSVAVALAMTGCGSCDHTATPPSSPSAQEKRAAEPAAPASAGTATPAGAPPQPVAPAASSPSGSDCFVYVDADPDFGEAPLTSRFSTELECGGKPVTFSWDFGDGTTGGNDASPSHVYEKEGDYVVTVTVATADGARGSDEIDIYVDEKD